FFFSSRRRHTRSKRDWSSDVCSSDLLYPCCKCHAGACALHFLMPRKGEHGVVRARVRFIATHKKNFRRATASCLVVFCELRFPRSEERRVGKECRSRRSPYH